MQLSVAIIASLAPALAYANVGVSWNFPKAPAATGLQNVSFGFNMANSPPRSGFYFAQQYNFIGITNVGYTGLQPRPNNAQGQPIVHAVFSSFTAGTTTTSPLCHAGADGGPGVSCALDFVGDYTHTYNCVVERVGSDNRTWRGRVVDTTTGVSRVMGQWTLPTATKGIVPSQVGFVEYYPFNSQPRPLKCNTLPKAEISFFHPTSSTAGVGAGTVYNAHEYGDCAHQSNFFTSLLPNGVHVKVGF